MESRGRVFVAVVPSGIVSASLGFGDWTRDAWISEKSPGLFQRRAQDLDPL